MQKKISDKAQKPARYGTNSQGVFTNQADGAYVSYQEYMELTQELEISRQEAGELSRFKEVMKSAAESLKAGKPLNLESLFRGELASAMFSMMLAGEFVRSGATNYLELLYEVPEFGGMTVTLQKVGGKTPGQRIAELEESNAQVIQSRDHYKRMTEEGLKQLAESRTVIVKLPLMMNLKIAGDKTTKAYFGGTNEGIRATVKAFEAALTASGIKLVAE